MGISYTNNIFGFYPEPLINTVEVSIKNLIETHNLTIQMSLASK